MASKKSNIAKTTSIVLAGLVFAGGITAVYSKRLVRAGEMTTVYVDDGQKLDFRIEGVPFSYKTDKDHAGGRIEHPWDHVNLTGVRVLVIIPDRDAILTLKYY